MAGKPRRPDDEAWHPGIRSTSDESFHVLLFQYDQHCILSSFSHFRVLRNLPSRSFSRINTSIPAHPRPYTLVIDLDHFLVCHFWDRETSRWRIAKRPGADLFPLLCSTTVRSRCLFTNDATRRRCNSEGPGQVWMCHACTVQIRYDAFQRTLSQGIHCCSR